MPIISVLWGLGLLSAISLSLLWSSNISRGLTHNDLELARINATAEAAVNRAVVALLDPRAERRWRTDGTAQSFEFDGAEMKVSVQDELGKIDLNQAEPSILVGLRSSKGTMGLMQIMPKTWTELRARYGLGADPYDPHDNILAGAAYIRELYDRYGAPGFLAAYNAGPGRYGRHLATGRPLPHETQAYVAALAPMINRARTNVQIGAVARSFAWANSSLFASRSAGISSDRSSPAAMRQNRSSRAHGVVDLSALVPHSGNLFVHRASEMTSR
jgi:hypothetical protein